MAKRPTRKPRGKVVYEQVSRKNWRASVIGSNGKHVVGGHGWDTIAKAKGGVASAAKIIRQNRIEVIRLGEKKKKRKR